MARKTRKNNETRIPLFEIIGRPTFFLLTKLLELTYALFKTIRKNLERIRKNKLRLSLGKLIKKKKKQTKKKLAVKHKARLRPSHQKLLFIFGGLGLVLTSAALVYYVLFKDLPSAKQLTEATPSLTTKIYDRHGTLLYQIYKDQNRSLIALDELPAYVKSATLAAEDKNFYYHHGFSVRGIIRATTNNLTKGTTQGGSTITQQLVKNVLLTPEKSLIRKLKELILAIETESLYTKDQILEMYLNQVGYGGTAYGIEQASQEYFGKSARNLTLAEAAMLAGLPISPTVLSPFGTNPYLGKIRQQQVLESMVESQAISENDKVEALATPLVFHPQGIAIRAPHFVMYVKDLLVKEYGEGTVARGGLEVITTLDLEYQDILQQEIDTELQKLTKLHVQNGAGLIISPKSGEILAMVGSHDFFDTKHDGQVNLTLQLRQPGSSIKPITYALALSSGATPNTLIEDAPICFIIKGQADYCPKNYDGRFHGQVTLRTALGSSYNIPAIKLLNSYGLPNMITLAKRLGITSWEDSSRFGLSLTLGGGEVTMLDLASVYTVFANGGDKIPSSALISVKDASGAELPLTRPSMTKEVISPSVAYQINNILSDPSARAPAFGSNSILNLPGKNIAVKTGTTNNLRDNWTFGYTQDILVATWVGNNDNSPMSSVASGVTGASPIWAHTIKKLLKDSEPTPFTPPSSMVKVNVSCTSIPKYEYFMQGTVPKIDCAEKSGTLLDEAATTSQ